MEKEEKMEDGEEMDEIYCDVLCWFMLGQN